MISHRFALAVSAIILGLGAFALLAAPDDRVIPAKTDDVQKQFNEMKAAFNKLADDNKKLVDRLGELKHEHKSLIDDCNINLKQVKGDIQNVSNCLNRLEKRVDIIEKMPRVKSWRQKLGRVRRGEQEVVFAVPEKTLGVSAWIAEIPSGLAHASTITVAFDPEKHNCRVIYNSNWNEVTENWLNVIIVYEP